MNLAVRDASRSAGEVRCTSAALAKVLRTGNVSPMEQTDSTGVHVAFVVNNYPPRIGGVERHVHMLAKGLLAAGARVTVVTLSEGAGHEVDEAGIRVLRRQQWLPVAGVLAFPKLGETRKIAALLADRGITVVSTHTRFFPMSFVGVRLGSRLGVPVIHTEHGSGFVRGLSLPMAVASRIIDLTVGRHVLASARLVLAVSEQVQRFVWKLAHRESFVFFNAIEVEAWQSSAEPPRRFVFIGRMVEGKGWNLTLEAFATLRSTGRIPSDFGCEFYGGGRQLGLLRKTVESLGLTGAVHVAGSVSPERLAEALRGSILVNPTVLAEGFQTSLLEALASGSQVVTFDVPGARNLADDGAPVRIVDDATLGALMAAMDDAVHHPSGTYSVESLAKWGWRTRVQEYLGHINRVSPPVNQGSAGRSVDT